MVIRLNHISGAASLQQTLTGVYRCEIPGAGGVITRYITVTRGCKFYIILWIAIAACSVVITINCRQMY